VSFPVDEQNNTPANQRKEKPRKPCSSACPDEEHHQIHGRKYSEMDLEVVFRLVVGKQRVMNGQGHKTHTTRVDPPRVSFAGIKPDEKAQCKQKDTRTQMDVEFSFR